MSLKGILNSIWTFVSGLWKKADAITAKITPVAIQVVEAIKKVNENSTGDILEFLISTAIPGKADDAVIKLVREKLKTILPDILRGLTLVDTVNKIKDPNQQLIAIINAINLSKDDVKNAYYHTISSLILKSLADGKLTWSEAVQIAEYYYTNIYKK